MLVALAALAWALGWRTSLPEAPTFANEERLHQWCADIGGEVTWEYEGAAGGTFVCRLASRELGTYKVQPAAPARRGE